MNIPIHLFNHSLREDYLDNLQFVTIKYKASINISIQSLFINMYFYFSGINGKSRIVGACSDYMFSIIKKCHAVLQNDWTI